MADQAALKQSLQELSKREENKVCCDCDNPRPQWASLSFAIFICLQCAGQHRGYGVHVSFVRSISMDTWQEDQVKRMRLGGNAAFKAFIESYSPAEQGGYTNGMSKYDQYHCWAAAQYRSKLDADAAGNSWSPSAPPANFKSPSTNTASPVMASSQGLRKSRASARGDSSVRSGSPASSMRGSPGIASPEPGTNGYDQKSANETYFSTLGQANSMRSADLPPSQGGRYQGFGNSPSPPPAGNSQHPSYSMSSANAPSLAELQQNPMAALGKGWSLFSAAVAGASKAVSENVITPGMERARDPNLHASVTGYLSEAQKRATELGTSANQWGRTQFGVDVGGSVGGAYGNVRDRVGGGSSNAARDGYGPIGNGGWETENSRYQDDNDDDDFLNKFGGQPRVEQDMPSTKAAPATTTTTTSSEPAAKSTQAQKKDKWDDWDDF